MQLNRLEKHLIATTKYLRGIGLTTFLSGSTLLQIIRDGEFKYRHPTDIEINLGCRAEDYTNEIKERIAKDHSFFQKADGYILFGQQENMCWEEIPFTFLGQHHKRGYERLEDMNNGMILHWPSRHVDKYERINYKHHYFNVPSDTKEWLKHYFGADWEKENLSWNWSDAGNLTFGPLLS